MKVYTVILDWSTEESDDIKIEIFNTYSKAFKRFNERIEEEILESWAKNAFDQNKNLINNYFELDEHIDSDGKQEYECWWDIIDIYNTNYHTNLRLNILEVK